MILRGPTRHLRRTLYTELGVVFQVVALGGREQPTIGISQPTVPEAAVVRGDLVGCRDYPRLRYRRLMTNIVQADQERGAVIADAPPAAIATLLAAIGDGLLLHALLDPSLDITAAIEALLTLLEAPSTPQNP